MEDKTIEEILQEASNSIETEKQEKQNEILQKNYDEYIKSQNRQILKDYLNIITCIIVIILLSIITVKVLLNKKR